MLKPGPNATPQAFCPGRAAALGGKAGLGGGTHRGVREGFGHPMESAGEGEVVDILDESPTYS